MLILLERIIVLIVFDVFIYVFESYINLNVNDFIEIMFEKFMELVINYLFKVMEDKNNIEYRIKLVVVDILGGNLLVNVGVVVLYLLSEIIGGVIYIFYGEVLVIVFLKFVEKFYKDNIEKFVKVVRMLN